MFLGSPKCHTTLEIYSRSGELIDRPKRFVDNRKGISYVVWELQKNATSEPSPTNNKQNNGHLPTEEMLPLLDKRQIELLSNFKHPNELKMDFVVYCC